MAAIAIYSSIRDKRYHIVVQCEMHKAHLRFERVWPFSLPTWFKHEALSGLNVLPFVCVITLASALVHSSSQTGNILYQGEDYEMRRAGGCQKCCCEPRKCSGCSRSQIRLVHGTNLPALQTNASQSNGHVMARMTVEMA